MRKSVRAIIVNGDKMVAMHRNKFGHEYYTLIGGGVDINEQPEQSLLREIAEESGIQVSNPRLVIVEDHDKFYGEQEVYLCEYVGGEPALSPDCDEFKINKLGENLYEPMWLPLDQLSSVPFVSSELQTALLQYLPNKFPEGVVTL